MTFLVMTARRPVVPCETLADARVAGLELLRFTLQPIHVAALVDGVVRRLDPERWPTKT